MTGAFLSRLRGKSFLSSYKFAFILYVFLIALIFLPPIIRGDVISPFNNDIELGVKPDLRHDSSVSNHKFGDYNYQFIPETNQHLHGNRRGWISTWSPWGEFGRPTFQIAVGRAYLLTNLLSYITDDPFIFQTYWALLMILLSGTFFSLFLRELDLHPISCGTVAVGFSTSTLLLYWLSFSVFLATFCWTLALLWLVARFTKAPSVWGWVGMVFSMYSLLMTGYPQSVILSSYLLGLFSLFRIWGLPAEGRRKLYILALLGAAIFAALIAALPVYLDIFIAAKNSARLKVEDSFFVAVLPRIESLLDLGRFMFLFFDPYLPGNPISSSYPFPYNGLSLTPFYFILFILSFRIGLRKELLVWHLFIVFCFITTLWPPAYLMLVHYFGFSLSRIQTLGTGLIPCFVVIAYVIDQLIRGGTFILSRRQMIIFMSVLIGTMIGGVYLIESAKNGMPPSGYFTPVRLAITAIILVGSVAFTVTRRASILVILTILTAVAYGAPLVLMRPASAIYTSSSLTRAVKSALPQGARYAFVGQTKLLPPNMESLIGLRSIHTYNSLSTVNYQEYLSRLGGKTQTYGRHARHLDSDFLTANPAFSYSGIGLILSPKTIADPGLRLLSQEGGLNLYSTASSPVLYAQLTAFTEERPGRFVVNGYLYEQPSVKVLLLNEQDDYQRYQVTPHPSSTLLFISRQYHPLWRAITDKGPAAIGLVNDFFTGVNLPAGARWVELEFRPYAYWSFIPQILFVCAFIAFITQTIIFRQDRQKRREMQGIS